MAGLGGMIGDRRDGDHQALLELAILDNPLHLLLGHPVQQQGLPLGSDRRFDLALLVLPFEELLAGHGAAGGHLFEPGDLALDDIQFLHRPQQGTLLFDQVFVGQAEVKQRPARRHRLALNRIDPGDNPRHRRGDDDLGLPRTFDECPRHGNRPLEILQSDQGECHAGVLPALLVQFERPLVAGIASMRVFAAGLRFGVMRRWTSRRDGLRQAGQPPSRHCHRGETA